MALEQVRLSKVELERRKELSCSSYKIPEVDLLQAESQLAQDEVSAVTALNNLDIAMLDLAQLLELPSTDGFDIAPLTTDPVDDRSPRPPKCMNRLRINHSIAAARAGVEASGKYVKVAQSGWLPSLSFSAGIGSSYYKTSGYVNENFGAQMRHNLSKSLGFSLSIPIFDGFSTRNSVRRARLQRDLRTPAVQRQPQPPA